MSQTTTEPPRRESDARRARRRMGAARSAVWLIVLAAVLGGGAWFRSKPASVVVVRPTEELVTESVAVSGRVQGAEETDVTATTAGRVAQLLVREGGRVEAGQPLARLDDDLPAADVRLAEATLRTARARLALVAAPAQAWTMARVKADTSQASDVARQRLQASEQRLAELERGATREQVHALEAAAQGSGFRAAAASAAVRQARARLQQSERDLKRQAELAADGAVSQADADRAQSGRDEALAALEAADESLRAADQAQREADARLRDLRAGTRPETLAQARADVSAARATLQGATRSGAAQVRTVAEASRREEVEVARATEAEAQRSLDAARSRLAQVVVRAPVAGLVSRVLAYPGASVSGSAPLVRIVPAQPLEVLMQVDENYLGKLRPGLDALITSDAYPGRTAQARVGRLGAQVDADRGSIDVRVYPDGRVPWLMPGQTVSVNLIVARAKPMLTVPLAAVISAGDRSQVMLLDNGVVRAADVRTGAPGVSRIPVLQGLTRSSQVLADAASAKPGARAAAAPAR